MSNEKELKDQRIPIMMTESEVSAIDDWSFRRRIRSRGEAIRRLCNMALRIDAHSEDLFETRSRLMLSAFDLGSTMKLEDAGKNFDWERLRTTAKLIQIGEGKAEDDLNKVETAEDAFFRLVDALSKLDHSLKELADYGFFTRPEFSVTEMLEQMEITSEVYNRILGRPSRKSHWTMDQIFGTEPPPKDSPDDPTDEK